MWAPPPPQSIFIRDNVASQLVLSVMSACAYPNTHSAAHCWLNISLQEEVSSSSSGQSNITVVEASLHKKRRSMLTWLDQVRDDYTAPKVVFKREPVAGILMRERRLEKNSKTVTWNPHQLADYRYFEAELEISKEVPLEVRKGIFLISIPW